MTLLCAAIAIDISHDDLSRINVEAQNDANSTNLDIAQVFYFNTGNSFKVIDRADRLLSCILFAASQDKFLSRHHNCLAFHSLKQESLRDRLPFHLMAHFMKFTSVQYSSPDDDHHMS